MRELRIAFNALFIRPGYVGGTVTYTREFIRALARTGECRLSVFVQSADVLGPVPAGDVHFISTGRFSGRLSRIVYEQIRLPGRVRKYGADILVSPGFVSPMHGAPLKAVVIHDLYYKRFPEFVSPWQRVYWTVMVPLSLRACDFIMTPSETTKRDLTESFPEVAAKTLCVRPGKPSWAFQKDTEKRDDADSPYFLVVGNLSPNKSIDTVIKAFGTVSRLNPRWSLIIAGTDRFGLLKRALSETPLAQECVNIHEGIDDFALADLYRGATGTIVASRYEGFGLPALEAMGCGSPVIASDCPAFREVCGDAAVYFPPGSGPALAKEIERVGRDPTLRATMRTRGRNVAANYSWDTSARVFLDAVTRRVRS